MNIMKLAQYAVLLPAIGLSGCKTPPATYRYAESVDDPEIIMTSNLIEHTHFSVNTAEPKSNRCADFETAGYILHNDSILMFDDPVSEIVIRVPKDKPVGIQGRFTVLKKTALGMADYTCGPVTGIFTPQGARKYKAHFNYANRSCGIIISDVTNPNAPEPVVPKTVFACKGPTKLQMKWESRAKAASM